MKKRRDSPPATFTRAFGSVAATTMICPVWVSNIPQKALVILENVFPIDYILAAQGDRLLQVHDFFRRRFKFSLTALDFKAQVQ